uniref:CARD domain-containing protein n=1 Tax=Denticeps clupeoides TaxID=299321 RepID=A0AAY4BKI5_9TELE
CAAGRTQKMLLKIRTKFVENVTGVLIKQLLDDLRETRVLNSEEADAVLEENSSRADRARCLMDMVRKKGKKSSERMVSWLKEHDPNLSQSIGLV